MFDFYIPLGLLELNISPLQLLTTQPVMSSESKQANKHTQNTILLDLQLVNMVSHKLEQIFTFIIRLHSGAPTALSIFLCIYDC